MNKTDRKQLIVIWGFVAFLFAAIVIAYSVYVNTPVKASEAVSGCPAGQTQIGTENGQPICRITPTGCPYGDSIPLDMCDKFKPEEQPVQKETQKPSQKSIENPIASCSGK